MSLSSAYIGAGNQASMFNRKASVPFKQLKKIYGEELALLNSEQSKLGLNRKTLSETDRALLKQKIRKLIKEQRRKYIINLAFTIVVLALAVFGVITFIF
jgi:chromosome condensin MukBEF MukE localization factor